ncbi:MAG TPA: prepilin-type N-terminal cleavage/methylation domain-containing protein [Guyparkeria sp.]|nr:prepilin-type N-terminal cleavage/methylation domain-containing protein [Guyparkeria sp.]
MTAGFLPGMRSNRGFTLIEVIVVIVIMAVLAGVALLSMSWTAPDTASDCASRIRLWLGGVEAESALRDETLYVAIERQRATAARLLRDQDDWATESVDQLIMGDCDMTLTANTSASQQTPDVLEKFTLAVTAAGYWSTPTADSQLTRLTITDRSGETWVVTPGE